MMYYYVRYKCVCFFAHRDLFSSSGRGSFLVLLVPGHTGLHGASVGPGRGPWHALWGFKVAKTGKQPRGGIPST